MQRFVERLMSMPYFLDAPDGDGGGAGGSGENHQEPNNDGTTKPDANDGKPNPPSTPKPGSAPDTKVEDARVKGILADLKKEREARQRFERDHTTAVAELERERKRVRSLAGIETPSAEEADEAVIRERLNKLIPGLDGLTKEDIAALREMRTQMNELRATTSTQLRAHGQKMLKAVTSGIQKELGGTLTERQIDRIERAYVAAAEANPEFLARHDAGDAGLVDEFVKEWAEDFFEPVRRRSLAAEVGRRRSVPNGGARTIPGNSEKKIDVMNDAAVEDLLVKGFRERGGEFRRTR